MMRHAVSKQSRWVNLNKFSKIQFDCSTGRATRLMNPTESPSLHAIGYDSESLEQQHDRC